MAKVNSADVGFEKQIWNAADLLRGSMDASEYKHVVLGLIFLKYISDRFEQKYRDLVAEGYGVDDTSVLNDSTENIITLVTCVMNKPDYRWCVQARQK